MLKLATSEYQGLIKKYGDQLDKSIENTKTAQKNTLDLLHAERVKNWKFFAFGGLSGIVVGILTGVVIMAK